MLPKILRLSQDARRIAAFVLATAAFAAPALAQLSTQADSLVTNRLTQPIDESARVTLLHTVHPLANAANDRGAAPDGMALDRIQVVLKRSAAQESALKQLISDMHTPGTANYHKWLTPDQFGAQFGPSDQDIATLEAWLQSKGFSVTKVDAGKQTLEMSGNVGQFRAAFNSQIHKYSVNGEMHYANATDPQIPAALAPVFGGFASLNNFRVKKQARLLGKATYNPKTDKATPEWTVGSNNEYSFVLSPGDYAVQYDLNPLYTAGTTGSGVTIGIINDANVNVGLVNQFRTLFGLPANPPQVIIDGNDPGVDGINNPDGPNYDSVEAYLDVEWAGAVAPAATVDLVIGADTALESGLILAAEHAVYGNIAPVLSVSFGACESSLGSGNQFLSALWEQAAAQGITVMVSTGDNGSAGCDNDNTQYYAVNGLGINGYASTPYNVAVGGTDFYYSDYNNSSALGAQLAGYWNETYSNNTPTVSINGVIPEQPWNSSQYGLNIIDYYSQTGTTNIAGGSGGASSAAVCAAGYNSSGVCSGALTGYAKPAWQSGTGVPADNVRDIPDVSLFASSGANASYYPICYQDGDCQPVSSGDTVQIYGVGGTSASSPSFAGIMALVNQKYGRQGQADFVLYPLAAQFPTAFHDVANGTNSEPCAFSPASPNCIAVTNPITVTDPNLGTAIEGQIGTGTTPDYNATAGYDLASGLGTIDANVLVTNWGNVKFATTTTTLTPSSTSFTHGTAITISGSVTQSGGTPTGDVALMTDSTEPLQQGQTFFTLSNGSFSNTKVNFLPGGTYNIWGQYGGDSSNGPSTSQKTQITVNPEASTTYFNILDVATPYTGTVAINPGTTNIPYGTQLILSAQLYGTTYYNQCVNTSNPPSSCSTLFVTIPTGNVAFADSGTTVNTAVVNAEGDAEYNSGWSVGSHSVTAKYSGDASYNASNASAITFSIVKDTPNLGLASAATTSSGSILTGQSTAITIQVENGANASNESSYNIGYSVPVAAPTGTVTVTGFPSGVPTSGTLSSTVDPSSYFAEGVATIIAPPATPAGTYNVKISYSGDSNYNSTSASGTVTIVSTTGLTSTTAAAISPVTATSTSPNQSITLSGTVTGQTGKAAPTGYVTIYSSGNTAQQVGFSSSSGDVSSFSTALNSQTLFQGANFVTVQYSGDTNYAPSSTTLANPIANPLADFSMVPNTSIVSVAPGSSSTDTIQLASVNGFSNAVTFTCTAPSGITCTPSPTSYTFSSGSSSTTALAISAASGTAAGTYNALVTGTDSTGEYVHTLGIQIIVTGTTTTPNFALANGGGITVNAGSSGTSSISVTPSGGFTGSVALKCAVSSTTTGVGCSLSPTSADVTGATAVTSTLTVTTTSSSAALHRPLNEFFAVGGGIAMAGLLLFTIPARRRSWRSILGVLVFAAMVGMGIGCGSSGGNNGGGSASYTVTVTGTSGSLSTTTTVNVTVN